MRATEEDVTAWLARAGAGLLALAAIAACGGEGGAQPEASVPRGLTVTFLQPTHGSEVPPWAEIEVVESGPLAVAVAAGEVEPPELAFQVDGELVAVGPDLRPQVPLPLGQHVLEVGALSPTGASLPDSTGDRIFVSVVPDPNGFARRAPADVDALPPGLPPAR